MQRKFAVTLCALFCTLAAAAGNPKPFVIPEIVSWEGGSGHFTLTPATVVAHDEATTAVAERFAAECGELLGFTPKVVPARQNRTRSGVISLSVAPGRCGTDNAEGYAVSIGKNIKVCANEPQGVIWATKTLLQLAEQSLSLPCGSMVDYPAFPMRGFMLDVARKYFDLSYLEDLVKVLAYYKMNTFQVHLNDNGMQELFENDWTKTPSGFRIESKTFPGLASKDGYYTHEAFREFQKEALRQGVTIIPEIDTPAHTLSFSHYKPSLGSDIYGKDHMDLFNPEGYEFLDALWREYLTGDDPVFVGKKVHIGTDEYSNKDSLVVEQFRAFTDRYLRYVESFGKEPMLWGALTHAKGATPVKSDGILMNCWYNGYADPQEMYALGYDILSVPDDQVYIVPAAGYYHDYLDTKMLYESWTPANVGNQTFDPADPRLKGGLFALWNDHAGNGISVQDVHHRIFDAVAPLSVKMWNGARTSLSYDEFTALRPRIGEAPGVDILSLHPEKGVVLSRKEVSQGDRLPLKQIGWNYRVEFTLTAGRNPGGTVLFAGPYSTFYLNNPLDGRLGFSRDGYTYSLGYAPPVGKPVRIAVEGDNKSTRLYVDGELTRTLDIVYPYRVSVTRPAMIMSYVQTLVFPLEQVGKFDGRISDLEVTVR